MKSTCFDINLNLIKYFKVSLRSLRSTWHQDAMQRYGLDLGFVEFVDFVYANVYEDIFGIRQEQPPEVDPIITRLQVVKTVNKVK